MIHEMMCSERDVAVNPPSGVGKERPAHVGDGSARDVLEQRRELGQVVVRGVAEEGLHRDGVLRLPPRTRRDMSRGPHGHRGGQSDADRGGRDSARSTPRVEPAYTLETDARVLLEEGDSTWRR
jgi:hypothetical protein